MIGVHVVRKFVEIERVAARLVFVAPAREVDRAGNQPFRIPQIFPPRLSTSNVGCWRWSGSGCRGPKVGAGSTSATDRDKQSRDNYSHGRCGIPGMLGGHEA